MLLSRNLLLNQVRINSSLSLPQNQTEALLTVAVLRFAVPSPNEMEDDSESRPGSMPQIATLLGAPKFIQIDCVHRWLKKKGLSSS